MQNQKNREIRLKSRPARGCRRHRQLYELAETAVPTPGAGQVLVRNSYISVDPYMRGRMVDRKSYAPPFQIGETLQGGAVGQVVASNGNDKFKVGDFVQSMQGWREWYVAERQRTSRSWIWRRARIYPVLSRRARHAGDDGLCGPLAHRGAEGRRAGVRLGGVGRGRLHRLPDRQGERLLRRGLGRLGREGGKVSEEGARQWSRMRSTTRRAAT